MKMSMSLLFVVIFYPLDICCKEVQWMVQSRGKLSFWKKMKVFDKDAVLKKNMKQMMRMEKY